MILPFSQTDYKVLLCVSVTFHWMYFVLVFGIGDGVLCIVHSILKSNQGISGGRRDEREGERGANQEKLRSLEPRGWGSGRSMCLHEVASESGEEGGGRREEGGGRREEGGGRREEGGGRREEGEGRREEGGGRDMYVSHVRSAHQPV